MFRQDYSANFSSKGLWLSLSKHLKRLGAERCWHYSYIIRPTMQQRQSGLRALYISAGIFNPAYLCHSGHAPRYRLER